uniref:Tyrosine specific protein phosphatases domain-containing protein n=1 Tax=Seriola lalandi dorsalis TaxID=1841481 RepID=A0A3B4X9S8_SERLL
MSGVCLLQMEQAHSAGAASSTGSLERASLFCASASTTASSSGLSSPPGPSLSLIPCTCSRGTRHSWKRVLVHCRDGFSLAPTCIIQYLMVKQNMRLIAAYELLRAKYPVNIRECHQNVLVSLERALRPGGNVDPECFKQAISLGGLKKKKKTFPTLLKRSCSSEDRRMFV